MIQWYENCQFSLLDDFDYFILYIVKPIMFCSPLLTVLMSLLKHYLQNELDLHLCCQKQPFMVKTICKIAELLTLMAALIKGFTVIIHETNLFLMYI